VDQTLQTLRDVLPIQRGRPIPVIGFYCQCQNYVDLLVPAAGNAYPNAICQSTSILTLERPTVLTKAKLSTSVKGNAAGDPVGIWLLMNPVSGATHIISGKNVDVLAQLITLETNPTTLRTTIDFSPYGGLRLEPNTKLGIAICGNAAGTASLLAGCSYHFTQQPGKLLEQ